MSEPFDAVDLHARLLARIEALDAMLLNEVMQNLDGRVLNRRSGALAASVGASVDDDGDVLTARVSSSGVPYAAIQEYGGRTSPHEIVATKAGVLAFIAGGKTRFARHVQHPGSTIPARVPFGQALDTYAATIRSDLKASVVAALQA